MIIENNYFGQWEIIVKIISHLRAVPNIPSEKGVQPTRVPNDLLDV